jgi:hypothetical protein
MYIVFILQCQTVQNNCQFICKEQKQSSFLMMSSKKSARILLPFLISVQIHTITGWNMLFNDIIQGQFYEMTGKCHYINKRTQTCPYSLLVRLKRVPTLCWSDPNVSILSTGQTQTCPYSLLVRPKRVPTPYWSDPNVSLLSTGKTQTCPYSLLVSGFLHQ